MSTVGSDHVHEALSRTVLLVKQDVFPRLAAEQIVEHLAGRRVRVRADARNVDTAAGQAAVVAMVVAIAQLGARLAIDVPDVHVAGNQPPLRERDRLASGLRDLCADLIQPADLDAGDAVDVTVLVGDTPAFGVTGPALRAHGRAWEGAVAVDVREPAAPWAGSVPFGPLLASEAVAAEVFRAAMADLAIRCGVAPLLEHRIGAPAPVRIPLVPLELPEGLDLGAVEAISGGAITNAALAALLRTPGLRGALRVIDDDRGAVSNLNRYALLRASLLHAPKVDVLAGFSTPGLAIEPVDRRLTPETAAAIGPLAPRVLVGVDHIRSRWLAQELASGWVCVGGTSRMEVVISEHVPGGPCAGCMHPYDDDVVGDIPTISFVSQLAGVLQAHRLLHHATTGGTQPAVVAYGLGLPGPRPLMALGQIPRADCPVRCAVSRSAAA
jgi:molybdopterin/thiamine biosynthesis adenylyltransferase